MATRHSQSAQARATDIMTHFLDDILRQPSSLLSAIDYLAGAGQAKLESAAAAIRQSPHVYLTGIGSSYHAALGVASLFDQGAHPVYVQDAAELLHFAAFPPDSVMIVISRSGQSAEIVRLLAKARESGTVVVGLTNSEAGALAQEAQIPIVISRNIRQYLFHIGRCNSHSGQHHSRVLRP
jgi:fructoselysine-6-P-deglycase FrlB-like protein